MNSQYFYEPTGTGRSATDSVYQKSAEQYVRDALKSAEMQGDYLAVGELAVKLHQIRNGVP